MSEEWGLDIIPNVEISEEEIHSISAQIAELLRTGEIQTIPAEVLVRAGEEILEAMVTSVGGIADPLGQLKQWFTNLINSIASWITETILSGVGGFIDWLLKGLSGFLSGVTNALGNVATWIQEASNAITGFINAILKFPDWFPNWFFNNIAKPISDALSALASKIWELLPQWLRDAISGIPGTIKAIGEAIRTFFSDPVGVLRQAFETLASRIWSLLPDWLRGAITTIQSAINSFVEAARNFFSDPLGTLQRAFSWLADQIWRLLPDWMKNAITGLQQAWDTFVKGLQEFLKDPVGFLRARFYELAQWIWDRLPDPLKWIIENVQGFLKNAWNAITRFFGKDLPDFFKWLWEGVQDFAKDPLAWLQRNLVQPLLGGLSWVWEQLRKGVEALGKGILDAFSKLFEALSGTISGIVSSIYSMGASLAKGLSSAGEVVAKGLAEILGGPFQKIFDALKESFEKLFKEAFGVGGGQRPGEIDVMAGMIAALLPSLLTLMAMPKGLKSLSHIISEQRARIHAHLRFLVPGGELVFAIVSRLPHVLYELGDAADQLVIRAGAQILQALFFPAFLPLMYPFIYLWRQYFKIMGLGDVPFRLISTSEAIDLARRAGLEQNLDRLHRIFVYHGYPEWFIENALATPDKLKITIYDRFNIPRDIPMSYLYEQPSLTDLTEMMVRDMFRSYEDYEKWAERLGLHPNVSFLYYLKRFRYPPPERLWEFFWRAASGMAWYTPDAATLQSASEEASSLGVPIPVPPSGLNPQNGIVSSVLVSAISQYMKWYDYARFAWIPGFTSDNWVMVETAAELPGRIDLRWIAKWGLFDFLASKGVDYRSSPDKFTAILESAPVNTAVYMDITNLSRMIQATGMVPYLTPLVAVAEVINAVADERTLLRGGIINLFAYGMVNLDVVEKFLGGLLTASFRVAYLDLKEGKWKEGYVNVPIMFLPPERKMLELRALIDRVFRIYRTALRVAERGYVEYLFTEDEVKNLLSEMVSTLNQYYSDQSSKIAGVALNLNLDTPFIEASLKAWSSARSLYTLRRIRAWVYRILGWIVYRLAYGRVTPDDAKRIANTLVKLTRMPEQEAKAVETVLSEVVGLATRVESREYVPTPAQIAAMAEDVPAVRRFASRVLEERRVPEEWRPIWMQYIDIRPLVGEVRQVLSRTLDLYERFLIDEKTLDSVLNALAPFGYEPREIGLIKDRGRLDRMYRAWMDLVGSPRQLVAMAEYVPQARQLALAEVKKRIDALPIPDDEKQFLYKMWEDYIRIRPVYDQVEQEITELINDYANGVIDDNFLNWALQELSKWGIDEYEADAIRFIAYMRRQRYLARRG